MEKIKIKIDPDLEDVIPVYLKSVKESIKEMKDAIKVEDSEKIRKIGHNLKGEGKAFGFDFITDAGLKLQEAGDAKDIRTIKALVFGLENYLTRIEIVK